VKVKIISNCLEIYFSDIQPWETLSSISPFKYLGAELDWDAVGPFKLWKTSGSGSGSGSSSDFLVIYLSTSAKLLLSKEDAFLFGIS
jgi:hypothetical protein